MTDAQWVRVLELYETVAALTPEEARALLNSSTQDPAVTNEVAVMLQNLEPPLEAPQFSGLHIGRYDVLTPIGVGSSGEVYAGRDQELNRPVALKFLSPEQAGDSSSVRRFIREARAASALNHPNIVTIYEVIAWESTPVIVMELVEGVALRLLCKQPLPVARVRKLSTQILQAIAAAHAIQIVHRDLKPENIMVRPDGWVKVLDLGLARHTDSVRDIQSSTAGMPVGTLRYMSPEQCKGEPATSASDVFAAGIVMYEMLTGRHPFPGDSPLDTAYAIVHSEPEPSPDLAPLDSLIWAMLSKDAAGRPSAEDVVRQLTAPPELVVEKSHSRWRSLVPPLVLASLLAAAAFMVAPVRDRIKNAMLPASTPTIAVLPLLNISADAAQNSLADSVTDALIGGLDRENSFRVVSQSFSTNFRESSVDVPIIAEQLKATLIVHASILVVKDRVKVIAQLVDAAHDRRPFTRTYERPRRDLPALQSEMVRDLAEAARQAGGVSPNPPGAADYLQALFFMDKSNNEGTAQAIEYFDRVIAADHTFAAAFVGRAHAHLREYIQSKRVADDALALARNDASAAVRLDPSQGRAHAVLGLVALWSWDWKTAERELSLGIADDPNYALGHRSNSMRLSSLGRHDEAIAEVMLASRLEPFSAASASKIGAAYMSAGRYALALPFYSRVLELDPGDLDARGNRAVAYARLGRIPEALAEIENGVSMSDQMGSSAVAAHVYALAGQPERTRKMIARMLLMSKTIPIHPYDLAFVYIGLGDREQAFHWLEKGVEQHDPGLGFLFGDQNFAPLRSDPRFADLLRRMKFPVPAESN